MDVVPLTPKETFLEAVVTENSHALLFERLDREQGMLEILSTASPTKIQ